MLSKLETLLTQNDNPIHWDTYFASLCLLISSRSSCERLHVGCVLVNDKRILSTGYNGFLTVLFINRLLFMQNKMILVILNIGL